MCGVELKHLDISNTYISGAGLASLRGKFPNLEVLIINVCCNLRDEGLSDIVNMSRGALKHLDVSSSPFSGPVLDELQGKSTGLEKLELGWNTYLTDHGLTVILRMCGVALKHLDLSGTNISGAGLFFYFEESFQT